MTWNSASRVSRSSCWTWARRPFTTNSSRLTTLPSETNRSMAVGRSAGSATVVRMSGSPDINLSITKSRRELGRDDDDSLLSPQYRGSNTLSKRACPRKPLRESPRLRPCRVLLVQTRVLRRQIDLLPLNEKLLHLGLRFKRVPVSDHQIRPLAFFDRSDLVADTPD